jgi:hypothetical protein
MLESMGVWASVAMIAVDEVRTNAAASLPALPAHGLRRGREPPKRRQRRVHSLPHRFLALWRNGVRCCPLGKRRSNLFPEVHAQSVFIGFSLR